MIFKNLFRPNKIADPRPLLVVGLGNPGEHYIQTRHNAGFLAVEYLRAAWGLDDFRLEKKFKALLSEGPVGKRKVLLAKPETFMNHSGEAVRKLVDFYRLPLDEIIIIHDDIDIKSGEFKISLGASSAGHNGVESIIQVLGSKDFKRIRLGIGRPTEIEGTCIPIHDYVLGKLSPSELDTLHTLFPRLQELLLKDKTPE